MGRGDTMSPTPPVPSNYSLFPPPPSLSLREREVSGLDFGTVAPPLLSSSVTTITNITYTE
jgi:hypothetical protein